jgi:uncharacterized protein
MGEGFDERRKGLEEEYFHRKNQEAIARLREKKKIAEAAKAAGQSSMLCPRCGGPLHERKFEEVVANACRNCGGAWLDPGELEQLTEKDEGGWLGRLWEHVI